MARVIAPYGGGTLVGKLGSVVAQRGPFGNVLRTFSKPVNPNTTQQQTVKIAMQFLSRTWERDLSQTQRKDWNDYGRQTPMTNDRGQEVFYSGRNHFIRTNSNPVRTMGPGAVVLDAPITPGIIAPALPLLTVNPGNGDVLLIQLDQVTPGDFRWYSSVSPLQNAATNFYKKGFTNFRSVNVAPPPTRLLKTFGPIPSGTKIFVRHSHFQPSTRKLSAAIIEELITP